MGLPTQTPAELVYALQTIPGVHVTVPTVRATPDIAPIVAQYLGVECPPLPPRGHDIVRRPSDLPYWPDMRRYQQIGAAELALGVREGLWWPPGVGKTFTTLTALDLAGVKRALVVTRAIGRGAWLRDAALVRGRRRVASIVGQTDDGETIRTIARRADKRLAGHRDKGACVCITSELDAVLRTNLADTIVVGWEVLHERADQLAKIRWDVVVLDESQYCKSWKSRRSKALQKLRYEQMWQLTATPVRDRARDLLNQLQHLDSKAWKKWVHVAEREKPVTGFSIRYCHAEMGQYDNWDDSGPHEPGKCSYCDVTTAELAHRLRYYFSILSRQDVMHELPQRRITVERLPAKRTAAAQRAAAGRRGIEARIAVAAEAKRKTVVEHAVDTLITGGKIVVLGSRKSWVHKTADEIRTLADRVPAVRRKLWLQGVTGDVEPNARSAIVDEYQERQNTACLVATIDCVSEAIDLHQTDEAVFAALVYEPGKLGQIMGRFARLGGRAVHIFFYVAEGTIDEMIERLVLAKLRVTEKLGASAVDGGHTSAVTDAFGDDRSDDEVVAELLEDLRAQVQAAKDTS